MVTAPISNLHFEQTQAATRSALTAGEGLRFDPFAASTPDARKREQAAYREYLERRDGAIDWDAWVLPEREERMCQRELTERRWKGSIDVDGFFQLFHRVGSPDTDARTLWTSLLALANEGELYGVEIEEQMLKRRGRDADELMVYHVMQEHFHTRLIAEACRSIGIERVTLLSPRLAHRLIIRAMSHFPDSVRYALVLLGEAIATVVFARLGELCAMFEDDPEVGRRLREIIDEIRHDEILHTLHCRSRLSSPMLKFARAVVPITAAIVEIAYPQIRELGMDRRSIAAGLRRGIEIPDGVDWVEPALFPAS